VKVLFDTNVLLDVLLNREPHAEPAARLLSLVDTGELEGVICATTVTTVHYLASRAMRRTSRARRFQCSMRRSFSRRLWQSSSGAPSRREIVSRCGLTRWHRGDLASPSAAVLVETDRHHEVAVRVLAEMPYVAGNLLHDAQTVILMREHGVREIVTRDADFHRFRGVEVIDSVAL